MVPPDGSAPVAIVAAGVKTPAGNSVSELWASLCAGRSFAAVFRDDRLPPGADMLVGTVSGFDPADYLSPIEVRRLDRTHALAFGAAQDAVDQCGGRLPPPDRRAIVCGVGMGAETTYAEQLVRLLSSGVRAMSPVTVPLVMSSSVAAHLSLRFGVEGPCLTVSTACASGASAIAEGVELLRRRSADLVLAGGVESLLSYSAMCAFLRLEAMSRNVGCPELASRPFDVNRDGFVMAEGAGFVVLQRLDDAVATGRDPLGLVLGHASGSDAHHLVAPTPGGEGALRCMRSALADAGAEPADVSHVNAHGTSTVLNDAAEAAALRQPLRRPDAAGDGGQGRHRAHDRRVGRGRGDRHRGLVADRAGASGGGSADARPADHDRRRARRGSTRVAGPRAVQLVRLRRRQHLAGAGRRLTGRLTILLPGPVRQGADIVARSVSSSNRTGERASFQYWRSGPRISSSSPRYRTKGAGGSRHHPARHRVAMRPGQEVQAAHQPRNAACCLLWWLRATHIRPTSTTLPRGSTTIPHALSVGSTGGNTSRPVHIGRSPSQPITWTAPLSYSSRS
jgi:3-oxoacyl-[acyl-carrier-protein] synthase II